MDQNRFLVSQLCHLDSRDIHPKCSRRIKRIFCGARYSPLFYLIGGVQGDTLLSVSVILVLVNLLIPINFVFNFSTEAFHEVVPKILQ
jgi:hypothetical protein